MCSGHLLRGSGARQNGTHRPGMGTGPGTAYPARLFQRAPSPSCGVVIQRTLSTSAQHWGRNRRDISPPGVALGLRRGREQRPRSAQAGAPKASAEVLVARYETHTLLIACTSTLVSRVPTGHARQSLEHEDTAAAAP